MAANNTLLPLTSFAGTPIRGAASPLCPTHLRPKAQRYVLGEEMEPDFSKYNLEELQEIKEALDKDKYPEKYSRLLDELV